MTPAEQRRILIVFFNLIGLALGFAFRDIAENFLSSLLMSIHAPFRVGDLIEVDSTTGFVRKVTPRATVLATFDGSQVQIPNSTIYKGKIVNFTATPLRPSRSSARPTLWLTMSSTLCGRL